MNTFKSLEDFEAVFFDGNQKAVSSDGSLIFFWLSKRGIWRGRDFHDSLVSLGDREAAIRALQARKRRAALHALQLQLVHHQQAAAKQEHDRSPSRAGGAKASASRRPDCLRYAGLAPCATRTSIPA